MSVPAILEQSAAQSEPQPVKHRPISRRIKAACDALVYGEVKTVTDAAKKANLARSHLSRELSKPHIAEYLRQKACRVLAMNAARAAAVKVELLDSQSDHVRDSASEFVLALAGIKPKADAQVSVNIDKKAGYVIDLTDEPKRPTVIEVARD
jgi:phage terminase small subunit